MARKITQDQLRRDIFKPLSEHGLLTEEQFNKAYPADKFERFSISGLNKARLDIFKFCKANPDKQDDIIQKANDEFNTLKRVNVIMPPIGEDKKGPVVALFVRPKIEKSMQGEELHVGDEDKNKMEKDETKKKKKSFNSEEEGADKKEETDVDSDKEEDDDEMDSENSDKEEDEESDKEGDEDENEENEKEEGEVSDEALKVLAFIKETLDGNGEVEEKEIADEEGLSDEETNKLIEELKSAGLIEVEEDEAGRGYNITGITEDGLSALEEEGGEGEEDENKEGKEEGPDVQGDKVVLDKQDFIDEHKKLVDKLDQSGDKKESSDQKEELDKVQGKKDGEEDAQATDNKQEEQQNQEESAHKPSDDEKQNAGKGAAGDPAQLEAFAKQTPTDKLEEYVKDTSNPPANIQVAQAELDRRKKEGDAGPSGEGNPGAEEGSPEEKAEKEEFDSWVDDYLESHDIEDLQKLIKDLILANPAETKVLKEHYRNDFSSQHKGNKAEKVDQKEFEEWIIEYLAHQPQAHLKEYAKKLASQDPDALNKLKTKYKALKDNKIV